MENLIDEILVLVCSLNIGSEMIIP